MLCSTPWEVGLLATDQQPAGVRTHWQLGCVCRWHQQPV